MLFDYSGTLFRLENFSAALDDLADLRTEERVALLRRLTAPVGPSAYLPPERQADWARRDLDPALHRAIHIELLEGTGLRGPGVAERFYERLIDPSYWTPYPDTKAALRDLADAGIPVGVVSNIAWDIREVFRRHGLHDLVTGWVLSYEEGRIKPDPELFRIACRRIGVPPEDVLMIGDSEEADGGAGALGSRVAIVEPLPTAERPDALLTALRPHLALA
ncbi:hydrolase [Gandjariella thermophila]|uniref:Hydrolase n=1 Tax=Gandjariella thermophila TaxID=1931992 RepID=A0A4D4J835_9PSEU|nr:hydrolase [Gandjariella thermophila]